MKRKTTVSQNKTNDTLLTTDEVAEKMKASPRHVHNLVKRRLIPAIKLGRSKRYDWQDVKMALKKMTITAK